MLMSERLREFKKNQRKEYEAFKIRCRVESLFKKDLTPKMVFVSSLLDKEVVADVSFEYDFCFGSIKKFEKLLNKFKPEPIVYFKNGCSGFRLKDKCEEKNTKPAGSLIAKVSKTLTNTISSQDEVKFEWYSKTKYGYINLTFTFGSHLIASIYYEYKNARNRVPRITECNLRNNISDIFDEYIKWYSSDEYLNDFTIYTKNQIDIDSLINKLKELLNE